MKYLIAILICACSSTQRPLPPPDGPGDCHTACENLRKIGGCGIVAEDASAACEDTCDEVSANESADGVRFPVGCLTNATTCAEAELCQ